MQGINYEWVWLIGVTTWKVWFEVLVTAFKRAKEREESFSPFLTFETTPNSIWCLDLKIWQFLCQQWWQQQVNKTDYLTPCTHMCRVIIAICTDVQYLHLHTGIKQWALNQTISIDVIHLDWDWKDPWHIGQCLLLLHVYNVHTLLDVTKQHVWILNGWQRKGLFVSIQPSFLQQPTTLLLKLTHHAQLQSQKLLTDCRW